MTTAHRPTWKAAVGRASEGGWSAGGAIGKSISALDAPAHQTLKARAVTEQKEDLIKKSLLALQEAEGSSSNKKLIQRRQIDPQEEERSKQKLLMHKAEAEIDTEKLKAKYDDSDLDDGGGDGSSSESSSDLDNDDSDLDESSDDDEDDEAALQAELAKIRAEREVSQRKAEAVAAAQEEERQEEAALIGNPLLAVGGGGGASGTAKRRWNEDVVFRHQAKGEPQPKKRFINDTVRNDFHRRFLNKFIR
jgi:protein CWC15